MPSLRPRTLASSTAILGAISLLTAAVLYVSVPENPPGDGFAAGITAIFAAVCVISGLLALAEAGLLFLVTRLWNPTARAQRFLTGGAVAGSLSVVLLAVPVLVTRAFDVLIPGPRGASESDSCSSLSARVAPDLASSSGFSTDHGLKPARDGTLPRRNRRSEDETGEQSAVQHQVDRADRLDNDCNERHTRDVGDQSAGGKLRESHLEESDGTAPDDYGENNDERERQRLAEGVRDSRPVDVSGRPEREPGDEREDGARGDSGRSVVHAERLAAGHVISAVAPRADSTRQCVESAAVDRLEAATASR